MRNLPTNLPNRFLFLKTRKFFSSKKGHEVKEGANECQKMIPSSEHAKRLATLFKRRLTTSWSQKEIRRLRQLVKEGCFESLDDLSLLERYYASERKKGDKGIHRRDLYTLLNNWQGELDRATAWAERNREKKKRPASNEAGETYQEINERTLAGLKVMRESLRKNLYHEA